ncbi:DUF6429 family protein [Mesorhizobium sp.]|uniref:DUF6429 family protein n=1 Tax=Mesorhizobium sp. TaxID=1871066 RepID=UPI0025C6BC9C|nr:DUF6429 family protein [Mesorhizobium sp.]
MEIDTDKIDNAVLGLLWLTLHEERRAWKGMDWDALDRLHQKGLIANPANKAKSVVLTDEGLRRAEEVFRTLFTRGRRRERWADLPIRSKSRADEIDNLT